MKNEVTLRDVTVFILSLIVISGFMFDAYLILSGKMDLTDPSRASLIGQVIGYIQGIASTVVLYYFGSTKSSEDKNSTIATAVDKIPSAPSTQTTTSTTTTAPSPSPIQTTTTAQTNIDTTVKKETP